MTGRHDHDHAPALIGWTNADGELVTEPYDPAHPMHRELALLLTHDCPECRAALLGEGAPVVPWLPVESGPAAEAECDAALSALAGAAVQAECDAVLAALAGPAALAGGCGAGLPAQPGSAEQVDAEPVLPGLPGPGLLA